MTMTATAMSDTATTTQQTVLDRLLEAGITRDRALAHLKRGWVELDGSLVTDADAPAEPAAHVELRMRPPYGD
jgi:hypothetical protein